MCYIITVRLKNTNMETEPHIPQPIDYERLRADASIMKPPQSQEDFLERYVGYTDHLIHDINHFDEDAEGNPIAADYVIYLDKSARPVAWMTRELWPELAEPNEEGEYPHMPEMRFLNIDRLPWRVDPAVEIGREPSNFREPTQEDIEGLRSIFAMPGKTADGPSPLDGKRILIVDEVFDSGDTMRVSTELVGRAFPGSKVKGSFWMVERGIATDKFQSVKVNDTPVWYEKDEESGRGIFGQVPEGASTANKKTNLTAGAHQFLSTRPYIPAANADGELIIDTIDQRGMALRRDVKRMAKALRDGEIIPAPYIDHEVYNGVPIDEYVVFRDSLREVRKQRERAAYLASLKSKGK